MWFLVQIILLVYSIVGYCEESTFVQKGSSNSKCFLMGAIRKVGVSADPGFRSLANQIRLTFDANDHKSCVRFISSYCRNNILSRGDMPVKLSGYFRPPSTENQKKSGEEIKPTHKYQVTERCKVITEEI